MKKRFLTLYPQHPRILHRFWLCRRSLLIMYRMLSMAYFFSVVGVLKVSSGFHWLKPDRAKRNKMNPTCCRVVNKTWSTLAEMCSYFFVELNLRAEKNIEYSYDDVLIFIVSYHIFLQFLHLVVFLQLHVFCAQSNPCIQRQAQSDHSLPRYLSRLGLRLSQLVQFILVYTSLHKKVHCCFPICGKDIL